MYTVCYKTTYCGHYSINNEKRSISHTVQFSYVFPFSFAFFFIHIYSFSGIFVFKIRKYCSVSCPAT